MSESLESRETGKVGAGSESSLERELRAALSPLQLPAGFAQRVIAQAERLNSEAEQLDRDSDRDKQSRAVVIPFRVWQVAGGAAVAAALVAGVLASSTARQHRDREHQKAVATRQFEAAMRITDHALAHTRDELERSGALQGD